MSTPVIFRSAIAATLFYLLISSRAAANTLANWTNTTGNNAWETPLNWDIGQVPNNSSYDVRLSIADPCNLSSGFQIGALNLSTNPAKLNLLPASLLAIGSPSGISNDGTITVNATAGNSPALLRFDTHAAVVGTGQINLKGGTISGDGVTVTNGAGHTISGFGDIVLTQNFAALVNDGTIAASSSLSNAGETLHLFLSDSAVNRNKGVIQSFAFSFPTTLVLEQGRLFQPVGGKVAANAFFADSTVQIGGTHPFTISGGNFETGDGPPGKGVIQGVAAILYGDITSTARFEIPAGGFTLINATTLRNFGTMTLNAQTSQMRFDAGTSLSGWGAIILTNGATLAISNIGLFTNHVTNGSDHTIKGDGTIHIDPGTTLTNNGTIAPGVPVGTLNCDGNLDLSYASNLAFEIGGTLQGITYDHFQKIGPVPLILDGKLTVTLINGFTPVPSDTFEIVTTQAPLEGAFTNARTGLRINTSDGTGSFLVSANGNNVVLSDFGPPLAPAQLLNISTRTRVLNDLNVLIGGFIVTGSDPKKVIVRGIGPSLTNRGVTDPLPNPTLELRSSGSGSGSIFVTNDDWKDSQQTEIEDTGIPPSNNLESAIVATLPANNTAYTVVMSGKGGSTGVGLIEIYDLNPSANSRLANLSSRGFVGTGEDVMIGGVIIGPSPTNPTTVLVRGLGPQLTNSGIPGALSDPILELHDPNGNLIAENDNWRDTQEAAIQFSIPPSDNRESAILVSLAPGNYTAIVRGANNSTGTALVEVYDLLH